MTSQKFMTYIVKKQRVMLLYSGPPYTKIGMVLYIKIVPGLGLRPASIAYNHSMKWFYSFSVDKCYDMQFEMYPRWNGRYLLD